MNELVVFPDTDALLVDRLAEVLPGELVSTKVPNPRPPRFVRVSRVGGRRTNHVTDEALVVVETWAATQAESADLARLVRAHVHALAQTGDTVEEWVRRVGEVAGPQYYPDPVTGHDRHTMSFTIDTRGTPL